MSPMTPESWVKTGAVLMFLTVALGAFGAHALKGRLDDGEKEEEGTGSGEDA